MGFEMPVSGDGQAALPGEDRQRKHREPTRPAYEDVKPPEAAQEEALDAMIKGGMPEKRAKELLRAVKKAGEDYRRDSGLSTEGSPEPEGWQANIKKYDKKVRELKSRLLSDYWPLTEKMQTLEEGQSGYSDAYSDWLSSYTAFRKEINQDLRELHEELNGEILEIIAKRKKLREQMSILPGNAVEEYDRLKKERDTLGERMKEMKRKLKKRVKNKKALLDGLGEKRYLEEIQ